MSDENETQNSEPVQKTEIQVLKDRATLMGITFSNNIGVDALKEKIREKLGETAPSAAVAPVQTVKDDATQGGPANPLGSGSEATAPSETVVKTPAETGTAQAVPVEAPKPVAAPVPAPVVQPVPQPTVAAPVAQPVPETAPAVSAAPVAAPVEPVVEASNPAESGEELNGLMEAAKLAEDKVSAPQTKKQKTQSLRQQIYAKQMRLVRLRITNMDPKKSNLPGEILTVANEYLGTVRKFIPYGEQTDDGFHVPFCLYNLMRKRKFLHITTKKDKRTGTDNADARYVNEFALEVLPPLTADELAKLANAQAAAGSID